MSKHILLLLILIQLNICRKKEDPNTFVIDPDLVNEKEITIKKGDEFRLQISCSTSILVLLNTDENEDFIEPKGSKQLFDDEEEDHKGNKCYISYKFKAKAVTKESRELQFGNAISKIRRRARNGNIQNDNSKPKLIVKVNIAK